MCNPSPTRQRGILRFQKGGHNQLMDDPIAYFLTWTTYGTWLPGDARGWVEYRHGWQTPASLLADYSSTKMVEDACVLTMQQHGLVQQQIEETCNRRNWRLHAVNCRSNHVHLVVTAVGVDTKKIRIDLKAWTARVLKKSDPNRQRWWSERGSIHWLYDENDLEAAIRYTLDAQDRKSQP